jgi:hypothetical protein
MKKRICAFLFLFILCVNVVSVFGQEEVELDYSLDMPDIETLEGTLSAPANIDLFTQAIIKIFVDTDSDGNITVAEAEALWDIFTDEQRANMSLATDDLEPLIQNSIAMDNDAPRSVEVLDMDIFGLVGPTNGSTPLAFVISFHAEFDVTDSITHIVSIGVNESFTGDVDFDFSAPSGWEVASVEGLSGSTIEGRNVYGTPVSQVNVRIREEVAEEVLLICATLGIIVLVVIILIIVLLVRKKKSAATTQLPAQYPPSPSEQSQPYQAPPPAQYPSSPPVQSQPYQAPPPPQQYQTPPPPQPAANTCPQCGGSLTFVQTYNRYYCPTCEQYR